MQAIDEPSSDIAGMPAPAQSLPPIEQPTTGRSRLRSAMKVVVPWLLLALLFTPGTLYFDRLSSAPNGWTYVLPHYLVMFGIWAACTPLIAGLLRRRPLDWPPTASSVIAHLSCAVAMVLLNALLMGVFDIWVPSNRNPEGFWINVWENLLFRGAMGLVLYTTTAALLSAWDALRRYHMREQSIVQAQLNALKAQLEPHFLFNTLNALSELVYQDPAAADRVLTQLAGLLRALLDRREHEHSLADEISMLRQYVSIQHTLLGDRLQMEWEIDDDLQEARLPTMLLQPIVENAIRHGVSQLKRGGIINLAASRQGDRLCVVVRNDGPLMQHSERAGGVGLSNSRARLQALYGSRQQLQLRMLAEGGCEVSIELPWCQSIAGATH
jgi:two-component system, LytTR family, sensor kinase